MLVRSGSAGAALALALAVPRLAAPQAGHAEHGEDSRPFSLGAMAVAVVSRASPAALGRTIFEGYLTQPMLTASAKALGGGLEGVATIDLEGVTLRRGEINLGTYGEGYIDRRHPHTYVHELMLGASVRAVGVRGSLFAGKGFVPFGTDDPMARPFLKYPVNHHLSQIIERVQVIAAARVGAVTLEGARFNGDEPEGPDDLPNAGRALDSWAARLTVTPIASVELSASSAHVQSPEFAPSNGLDHRKENVAVRLARPAGRWRYALVEWSRTREHRGDREFFRYNSLLAESEWWGGGMTLAVRAERTERPEEDRLPDPYRSVRPLLDFGILGKTRWEIVTVHVGTPTARLGSLHLAPFAEAA